jgi:uncharacterized protein YbjT (DUF2867 family)
MFVVLGANGNVGGAAATELRRRGHAVKAVVRDVARGERLTAAGCETVVADLSDARALERALDGADGVLVMCPLNLRADDVEAEAQRIIDAIGDAVETARPQAVVALSDYGAHHDGETGIPMIFRRFEERLRSTPGSKTFLRSAEHMQNWLRYLRVARERGVMPSLHAPLDKRFPTVSAFDVGLAAADFLTDETAARDSARVVHIEGPRRYTASEMAKALGPRAGRPVEAQALPRENWIPALRAGGLTESYARLLVQTQDAHEAGTIEVEPGGELRRGQTEPSAAFAVQAEVSTPQAS